MIQHALVAAAWAGLIALDFTGLGPWLITQPLVCGPVFGYWMGNIPAGLIIGGIVQLLWMDVSPIGVGIPFDACATTILATFWCTLGGRSSLSQIILALFMAVPLGFVFRSMDQIARRLNVVLVRRLDKVSESSLPTALWGGIFGGLLWSWARYATFYFLTMCAGGALWRYLAYSPRMTLIDRGLTLAAIVLPVAGMGVTLELFMSDEPEGRWAAFRVLRGPKGTNE